MILPAKYLFTAGVVLIAVAATVLKYWHYVANPWTRDGQVRAEVIQITPRVSGPIVTLPIRDNQGVGAGELLFEIDPRTFRAARDQARAQLDETRDKVHALEQQVAVATAALEVSRADIAKAESTVAQLVATVAKNLAEYQRQQKLLPEKATSQKALERARANYEVALQERYAADAGLAQAQASLAESAATLAEAKAKRGAPGDANSQIRAARAALRQAELKLEFTQVRAPVEGYVTNLNLRLGSHAVANQPVLALVDVASYWVAGYFKENRITDMRPGDRALVTLMAYPDSPLKAQVDSIGWGIAQQDGSTGVDLLPTISPTFEWIRLAQRVPVRIHLDSVPPHVQLRVGTTCSVLVMAGTAGRDDDWEASAAPAALQ